MAAAYVATVTVRALTIAAPPVHDRGRAGPVLARLTVIAVRVASAGQRSRLPPHHTALPGGEREERDEQSRAEHTSAKSRRKSRAAPHSRERAAAQKCDRSEQVTQYHPWTRSHHDSDQKFLNGR